jgi:protein-S-isoprenylcysteine O-methyltransferase Ste14
MNTIKNPYIYDLIASILSFAIIILSNILPRGENNYLKIAGVCLLVVAASIWVLPFIHLKKYGNVNEGDNYYETNKVVEKGIYGIVRHPQYLAYILLTIGFTLLSQNWIIVIISVFTVSLFYIYTVQEENELRNRFGDAYQEYCMRVPRFNLIAGTIHRLWR